MQGTKTVRLRRHPPETRRQRQLGGFSAVAAYEHPHVLGFAARNQRGRFYIPSKTNQLGSVPVDHILLDKGCSTLLLPFPLATGFPRAACPTGLTPNQSSSPLAFSLYDIFPLSSHERSITSRNT